MVELFNFQDNLAVLILLLVLDIDMPLKIIKVSAILVMLDTGYCTGGSLSYLKSFSVKNILSQISRSEWVIFLGGESHF